MVTEDDINEYYKNGYVIIENFVSDEECDKLKAAMMKRIDTHLDFETHPRTKDGRPSGKALDVSLAEYFLDSQDKIHFFLEENAFSDETGEFQWKKHSKYESVCKIGHSMHTDMPEFIEYCQGDKVKEVLKMLDYKHPVLAASLYIFKHPKIGSSTDPHKDSTYFNTGGTRLVGLWLAIDDATEDNACMKFIPGSHTEATTIRLNRNDTNTGCNCAGVTNEHLTKDVDWVNVEAKKGSLVLFDGEMAHRSPRNLSDKPRNAFTFHVYEGEGAAWTKGNWCQPTEKGTFTELY